MELNGKLNESDALRLLATLRLARSYLGDNEHIILTTAEAKDITIELTVGQFIDHVLHPYREHEQ